MIHERHEAGARMQGDDSGLDRIFFGAFLLALLLIAFVAGGVVSVAQVFPGPQIVRAYEGGRALYAQLTQYDDVLKGDLWYPARTPETGVTVLQPERMQPGATLYTSGEATIARLVSPEGEVLHEWSRSFSELQGEAGGIDNPRPDEFVYFRDAKLFPNGDLLVVIEGNGATPYGYAVAKLDRNSDPLWIYYGGAHHDLEVGPDGRIYAITHEVVQHSLEGHGNLADAWLEDYLVVLSPDGEEELKMPLTEAVAASPFQHLLHTVASYSVGDPLHTNAVTLIGEEAAAAMPFAEPGQVMLSFRELNAIGIADLDRQELVWAQRGPWLGQHDPDPLANGNILLFDNYGNYERPEGISRVIEFNPVTMEIVWQYAGTPDRPLNSAIRADQERLANGNTLIAESNGGRIVEVTPEGDVVWEFINPVRAGEDNDYIPIVSAAQRIAAEDLDPEFLALSPTAHPTSVQEAKENGIQ